MRIRKEQPVRCDGVTRRDLVRVGGLSALGLSLSQLFQSRASAAKSPVPRRAKRCVLIWLDGGPSHLETFDLKPDAPREVRGPFSPIATRIPGMQISEFMPQTAKLADQIALVRSMTSPLGEHNLGTHYLLTGYKPTPVLEYPTYGAVVSHLDNEARVLPKNIAVPSFRVGGSKITGHGFLSSAHRPFSVGGDPSKPDFAVRDLDLYPEIDVQRLQRRRSFMRSFDAFHQRVDESDAPSDPAFEQAFRLVTTKKAKEAFDLSAESQEVRRRYGGKSIGQSCLLARRLLEADVPFVTVSNPGWDTHNQLVTRLKDGYTGAKVAVGLIPSLDLALSALLADLQDRRMLDDTLVVVMGEFGRTPKINTAGGRDHWPRVFSVLLAGAGIPGGQVIGSSDSVGEGPIDRPTTPNDLAATIYQILGIDPRTTLHTSDGRPVQVSRDGQVMSELLG